MYFAVYQDTVYHHGAGFRVGTPSGAHRVAGAPAPVPVPRLPLLGPAIQAMNRRRWQSWARRTQKRRIDLSKVVYEKIQSGGSDWLADVVGRDGAALPEPGAHTMGL